VKEGEGSSLGTMLSHDCGRGESGVHRGRGGALCQPAVRFSTSCRPRRQVSNPPRPVALCNERSQIFGFLGIRLPLWCCNRDLRHRSPVGRTFQHTSEVHPLNATALFGVLWPRVVLAPDRVTTSPEFCATSAKYRRDSSPDCPKWATPVLLSLLVASHRRCFPKRSLRESLLSFRLRGYCRSTAD
jgi:hypothetical protein